MSKEIDEKVVEMRFDNKQFEENVSTSISSLDKLKKALQLKDAGKAFENIEKQSSKIDFSGLSGAIDKVGVKFTALQITAYRALENIVDRAMSAGERLIKSLSIDQINAGWTKYEEKTQAVQTIMSATQDTWKQSADEMVKAQAKLQSGSEEVGDDIEYIGDQMQYVNEQIEKLNWFTDETSYNFTDMISNIGKFTANGVSLDKAVTAMQGIATWGATAGAQIPQVGSAMYNLSQALSTGSVQVKDWMSIENANMATFEFKKMVLETAAEMKTLTKVGDNLYRTAKGTEVTAESMRNVLNEKWFTSDVLISVLKKYGDFSDKLYEVQTKIEDAGFSTTNDVLNAIKDYEEGLIDLNKISKLTGVSVDELDEDFKTLSSDTMALGRKAFIAAQEAKTFSEAIQATKDAVSTGWMNIFELIFGNYEEAKKLWTTVSNELYDIFAEPLNGLFDLISDWKLLGGRDLMLEGVSEAWEEFKNVLETIKQAFRDVFPETTGETLIKITQSFVDFIKRIKGNKKALDTIYQIFNGIAAGAHLAIAGIKSLFHALSPAFNVIKKIAVAIIDGIAAVGKWVASLDDASKKGKFFERVAESIKQGLDKINGVLTAAGNRAKKFIETFGNPFEKIKEVVSKVASFIGSALKKAWSVLTDFFGSVKKFFENGSLLKTFGVGGGIFGLGVLIERIRWFIEQLVGFKEQLQALFSISKVLTSIQWAFEGLGDSRAATSTLKVAAAIGILAFSLYLLSKSNPANLAVSVVALSAAIQIMLAAIKQINAIPIIKGQGKNVKTIIRTMLALSVAVWIMSKALKTIADAGPEGMASGTIVLAAIVGILIVAINSLSKIKLSSGKQLLAMAGSMILIALALRLIVGAVRQLGEMDVGTLAKGIVAIGILLLEMAAFVKLSGGSVGVFAASAGMILLAISIKIMASAMADIADISWEGIGKGLVAIGGILLIMTGILYLMSPIAPMAIIGAAALLIMSFTLKILASVLKDLAELSKEQLDNLKTALVELGALLIVMAAALSLASITGPFALAGAAGFLIMSVALKMIVWALKDLAVLKPEQIKNLEPIVDAIESVMIRIQKVLGHLRFAAKKKLIGSGAFAAMVVAVKGIAWALQDLAVLKPEQIKNLEPVVDAIEAVMIRINKVLGHLRFGAKKKLISSGAFVAIATSVLEIAKALEMLSEVQNLSDTSDVLINFFKKIKSIAFILGAFPLTFISGTKSLSNIGKSIKSFGESFVPLSEAVRGLFQYQRSDPEALSKTFSAFAKGIWKLGWALKAYGPTAKTAANAMPNIASGIKAMSDSIVELEKNEVDPDELKSYLEKISTAFKDFGKALKDSPFWFPRTRAAGIAALSESIKTLGDGVRSLRDISSWTLGTKLDSIGKVFEKLGTALGEADGWKPEERASAIVMLTGSIKDLAEGLIAFKDAYMDISGLVNNTSSIKEFYANNFVASIPNIGDSPFDTLMSAISTGLYTIGDALKHAPVFNVEEKGVGVAEVAKSLKDLAVGIKAFHDIGLDATGLDSFMESIGNAITTIGQSIARIQILDANFFITKATGLAAVMSAFYDFGNAIKTLIYLVRGNNKYFDTKEELFEFIETLGTAMEKFGTALNTTDFGLGVKAKANGIVSLLENIEKIPSAVKSFVDIVKDDAMDIQTVSSILTTISQFIKDLGFAIMDTGFFGIGIKAKAEGIVNVISALDSFTGIIDACKQMDEESGSFRTTDFNAIVGTIGTFISLIGTELNKFSFFGIGVKAKADAIVNVVNTIDTITKAMVAMENKKINANFISDRLDAITTGLGNFISLTDDIWLVLGDSAKIDLLVRASGAIKTVSEAITSLQTIPSATQSGISAQSITAQGIAVKNYISGFITALKEFDGVNIDTETFTACVTAVSEVGPALSGIATINTSKVRNVLKDAASALTSFVDDTKGSVVLLEKFSVAGKNAATNFTTSFSEAIQAAYTEYQTAGDSIILQMSEGMKEQPATSRVKTISAACVSAIRSYRDQFYNAGKYVALGFVEGLGSEESEVIKAGRDLAEIAHNSLDNYNMTESPSKLYYRSGKYCVTGYVNSFYDGLKDSELAGKALAMNSVMGAQYALRQIKAISESDLEINPRIRPVLDLSDVRAGAGLLSGYFGAAESLSVGTSVRLSSINSSLRNQNGSSNGVMKTDNSDIISELRSLRSDMNAVTDKLEGMQIAINGKKAIAYLTKEMDRSLGQVESRRKRGV